MQSFWLMRRLQVCSVQQAACNGSVQRATCMRWALPERPHGVCVIIFSAPHCEFCIISIYKLLPRVGKSCTNKGRKNPKKRNLTEAPQTENLISQLISIWTNLELQQIRRRWRGRCTRRPKEGRSSWRWRRNQSRSQSQSQSQRFFKAKAFVALEELSLEHCSLWLPLATCWVARNCVTAQLSGWAGVWFRVGMVRPATRSIKSA